MTTPVLETRGLSKSFGALRVARDIELTLEKGARRAVIDEAIELIETLALGDDALKRVRELPYGRQRLVEIAMAFAQRPKLLLLDEPAAGVPSSESHLILDVIARLDKDIAVLII